MGGIFFYPVLIGNRHGRFFFCGRHYSDGVLVF